MANLKVSAEISARIIAALQAGFSLEDAFNLVLGPGAYRRLAAEIYDAFRARQ